MDTRILEKIRSFIDMHRINNNQTISYLDIASRLIQIRDACEYDYDLRPANIFLYTLADMNNPIAIHCISENSDTQIVNLHVRQGDYCLLDIIHYILKDWPCNAKAKEYIKFSFIPGIIH
jgi:hypothetical protein